MKHETKTADIRATLGCAAALICRKNALTDVTARIDAGYDHAGAGEFAISARAAHLEAAGAVAKIPAARRTIASATIAAAKKIGMEAAQMGGEYSGDTSHSVRWGATASAETISRRGAQYSRACSYKKTDADHVITLDPAGVSRLVEEREIVSASARDGLPLIAYYPDGAAVWVMAKNKSIVSQRGWVAGYAGSCYHSTVSMADAMAKCIRKIKSAQREDAARRKDRKAARRARLIARLCGGISATIGDAKALGYCAPGIAAFQARHGFSDAVPLPELVKTGNPSAVALALSIARKMKKSA